VTLAQFLRETAQRPDISIQVADVCADCVLTLFPLIFRKFNRNVLFDFKNGTKCTPIFPARAMTSISSKAPLNDLRLAPRWRRLLSVLTHFDNISLNPTQPYASAMVDTSGRMWFARLAEKNGGVVLEKVPSDAVIKQCMERATVAPFAFGDIRFGQLEEGMDEFYKDFRNKSVYVTRKHT
jgi:hypothetical protein